MIGSGRKSQSDGSCDLGSGILREVIGGRSRSTSRESK
jgi:hypothetical protein